MQKTLAGINPYWAVRNPITQMSTLLIAAKSQPFQQRLPIRIVEQIVSTQDK
jgi:hypothetical protein